MSCCRPSPRGTRRPCSRGCTSWWRRSSCTSGGCRRRRPTVFKHALIQDAAYQSLLRSTRQQYHQRIAQVLEAQFPEIVETQPELLAHHYTEAGLHGAGHCLLAAGGAAGPRALGQSGSDQHLTKGLELLATLPETPERAQQELDLQIALGPALMATKGYAAPEVEQTYARARALCQQVGETPQLFPALWGLCRFYRSRGALQTARELGEQLLRLAQRAADPTHLLEAHDALGDDLVLAGRVCRRPDAPGAGDRPHRPDSAAGPGAPPWRGAWGAVPGLWRPSRCGAWAIRRRPCSGVRRR